MTQADYDSHVVTINRPYPVEVYAVRLYDYIAGTYKDLRWRYQKVARTLGL